MVENHVSNAQLLFFRKNAKTNHSTKLAAAPRSLKLKLVTIACIIIIVFSSELLLIKQTDSSLRVGMAYGESTPTITITRPVNSSITSSIVTVKGTSQNIPSGDAIWVLVYVPAAIRNIDRYYPMQWPANVTPNGDWSCLTFVGGTEDSRLKFDAVAVLADNAAQTRINEYNATSANSHPPNYAGIPSAEWPSYGTIEYSRVTVALNTTLPIDTVLPPVSVSALPSTVEVEVDKSIMFNAIASGGSAPYSYQWYEGTAPLMGQTNPLLIIAESAVGSYIFYCKVTDSLGFNVNSNTVSAAVKPTPNPSPSVTPDYYPLAIVIAAIITAVAGIITALIKTRRKKLQIPD